MRQLRLSSRSALLLVACSPFIASISASREVHAAPDPQATVQPIELRDVLTRARRGTVIERQVAFQAGTILDGPSLYRALHRPDLAKAYESREATKLVLGGLGMAALIGGFFAIKENTPVKECTSPPFMPSFLISPPGLTCETHGGGTPLALSIGVTVLAPVVMIVAGILDAEPVPAAERRRLVSDFNASLSTPSASGARPTPRSGINLEASPTVSPDGAGVVIGGSF